MRTRYVLLCLLALSVDAVADPAADPSANSPNKPVVRRTVAPNVSETRVVVLPDGSLGYVCHDRPNPKATQLIQNARATRAQPDRQP